MRKLWARTTKFYFFAALFSGSLLLGGCQGKSSDSIDNKVADSQSNPAPIANELQKENGETKRNDSRLGILHWNIESGGNDPKLIAKQLLELAENHYSIYALSEVDKFAVYEKAFSEIGESGQWQSVLGASGASSDRNSDQLMLLYDSKRLKQIENRELNQHGDYQLNDGRHRSPMLVHFECRVTRKHFLVLHNHLARGNAKFRQQQAKGLREFARDARLPIIAIGDYNFDFTFATRQGNPAFNEMMRDGVWKWIEPEELIDTNWYDREKDGEDDYPGSMLDFTFVSGPAQEWDVTSRVIVREGDFPDDERTSDHRPTEVIVRF